VIDRTSTWTPIASALARSAIPWDSTQ